MAVKMLIESTALNGFTCALLINKVLLTIVLIRNSTCNIVNWMIYI